MASSHNIDSRPLGTVRRDAAVFGQKAFLLRPPYLRGYGISHNMLGAL